MTTVCKWLVDGVCVNADSPYCADFCPVTEYPEICRFEMRVREAKIEELNLSVRAYNAMKRAGFNTVEQVLQTTPHQLSHYRGIGEKVIEEVYSKIKDAGYVLPY